MNPKQFDTYWRRFSGVEKKLLLLFVLVLIVNVGIIAFQGDGDAATTPAEGGLYVEGLVGQPQYINPLLAPANLVDADLVRITYDGLYEFDKNLNFTPVLAASLPTIAENGTRYTITLKEGLTWHDGAPLTADDVVFTLQAIQNPEYKSPLRSSWNRVEIQKIDDHTVDLKLREASASFVANLTVSIIPAHIWGNIEPQNFASAPFNLDPIGSGPYRIDEINRNRDGTIRSMIFEKFEAYHEGVPYINEFEFKFYETTDDLINAYQRRDIMGLGYIPFNRTLFIDPGNRLDQKLLPLPQYQAVFINRTKNPAALDDVNVRMAMAKAVNKEHIIQEVYGGQAQEAYGPILPGHLGYHEQIPGAEMNMYDPAAAKALLEKSGWVLDESIGFRKDDQDRIITISLATNNFTPNVRAAELLKEMWEDIGIQIILNIETLADLEEQYIRPRNYELLLFSENVGADPDPYPFWHSSQLRDPGLNLSTFANQQADRLLVEARGNISPEERAQRYRQFQEIFVGDVPAIFLVRSVYVYNISQSVHGVDLGTIVVPSSRFADVNQWYIKTKKAE